MIYNIPTVQELKQNTENGNHKFSVISFFAGGGGSSTGYRMAGGKVFLVNEFIDEAVKTYKANWPTTKIIHDDIRKITPEHVLELSGFKKFELDIMDGSPPCSAFSTAGSREKGWGKTKKYSDKQQENVEDLFFEYIRMLRGIMPKVFIAENVSGLAKGTAKGYLNDIMRQLRASGYNVTCKILDAKLLGVPQSRTRTIFVGIRNDIWRDDMMGSTHPKPLDYMVCLNDAFKGLVFTDNDKKETELTKYAVYQLLKTLKEGETHEKRFNLGKAHRLKPSGCITATTGCISAAKICHWDNRAFTVNEIKRIMSIPDDYVLTGSYQQKVERLGRMVAPFMMRAVAQNLLDLGVFNGNT